MKSLGRENVALVISLELSAAVDTINHKILEPIL